MKRYLAIFLAVLMMIPTFAMAEGVVKIGVFEPASGDSGAGGKQEMLGRQRRAAHCRDRRRDLQGRAGLRG